MQSLVESRWTVGHQQLAAQKFFAESLLLAETGNSIGAIQIAGTGMASQIPFFITACDYTLIGEEFLTASAILSNRKDLIGSIRGQDVIKVLIIIAVFLIFNIV